MPCYGDVVICFMACVVCLGEDGKIQDFKSHYGCSCTVVPFHNDCWTRYDQTFKKCPFCRKENEVVVIHVSHYQERLVRPLPHDQEGNFRIAFMKSRFITDHPCWNAFFALFVIGYSGLVVTLFIIGLYKYYSQLNTLNLTYSFLFTIFNIYDIISVLVDQTFGVLWMIQTYLFTTNLRILWFTIFYLLVVIRGLVSLSYAILNPFLQPNPWTQSGYVLVLLQGLFMTIVGCICCCCNPRH